MHPDTLAALNIADGDMVVVATDGGQATVPAVADFSIAPQVVRLAAAHLSTANLDAMFGPVTVRQA